MSEERLNSSEWKTIADVLAWAEREERTGELYIAVDLRRVILAAEKRIEKLLRALNEIAIEHDGLERDPVQHCTNLVRIARAALKPFEEEIA